jgi:hypothetical protein
MFALEKQTKIKLKKFDTLSAKDRDTSENVGLQVVFGGAALSADLLALLDGSLRGWLYEKKAAAVASSDKKGEQKSLDGVETETLTACAANWASAFTSIPCRNCTSSTTLRWNGAPVCPN